MMNALRALICTLMLALTVNVSVAADAAKDKRIDVPPVDVPEKTVIQPTSAEIHAEAPPEQTCSSCHGANALDAERKPLTHFLTTKDCGTCHFNKSWVPLRNYTHTNGKYSGMQRDNPDISPQDCIECHTTNIEYQTPLRRR
jgi:hypothetical protein